MIDNLYRSPTDKWLTGVAGGLAERAGVPSLLVRLLFVILGLLFNIVTVLIYVTLWLAVPEGSTTVDGTAETAEESATA